MSEDHFTLDIDPEGVRAVRKGVQELEDSLRHKGQQVKDTPGDIGLGWTGEAATTVKGEMTGLGTLMRTWATKLDGAVAALAGLASDYDEALAQLPSLNRRWNEAQTEYERACARADRQYDEARDSSPSGSNRGLEHEFSDIRTQAKNNAAQARRSAHYDLEYSYGMTKVWLAQQTRACGASLAEASPFDVPASALADLANGKFPSEPFDHSDVTSGLAMTEQYHENRGEEQEQEERDAAALAAEGDLENLNQAMEDGDSDAVERYLQLMGDKSDDDYYAEALVRELGPEGYTDLMDDLERYLADDGNEDYRGQLDRLEVIEDELLAFNETVAAGLSHYEDQELVTWVHGVGGGSGKPALILVLASAGTADGRLSGLAVQFAHRYDETEGSPGGRNIEIGPDLIRQVWPNKEEMTRTLIGEVDPERFAILLNNLSTRQAGYIAEALREDNWSTNDGPEENETWEARVALYGDLLDEAAAQRLPGAMEALLTRVGDVRTGGERTDELWGEVADQFSDPETLIWMAQMRETIDQEVVARAVAATMSDTDAEDLTGPLLERALQDPQADDQKIAEYLGYTLGLMDAAGVEPDYDKVWGSIMDSMVGAVPGSVTGPAWSLFKSLLEAQAVQDAAYQDHGDGWSEERAHKVFAWTIDIGLNGPPAGYQDWLEENQHRVPPDAAEEAMIMYINEELSGDEYDSLDDLQEEISRTRDVADGTG